MDREMTDGHAIVFPSFFGSVQITLENGSEIQQRPLGKVRGRRRYYRNLQRKSEFPTVRRNGWYDFMHWHIDRSGLGNLSWRDRKSHLAVLFASYRSLLMQIKDWNEPHQCWLVIDAIDSSADAVYLHTPNPNGTPFPCRFEWVRWEVEIPALLTEFVAHSIGSSGALAVSGLTSTYDCVLIPD